MEEIAKIVEIKDNFAIVEFEKKSHCEKCRACRFGTEGKMLIEVENVINANVGDKVILLMDGKDILKASFIVYLFPTLIFLISIFLSHYIFSQTFLDKKVQEILSLLIGFALLLIAFKAVNLYDRKIQKTSLFRPKMIKKIDMESN